MAPDNKAANTANEKAIQDLDIQALCAKNTEQAGIRFQKAVLLGQEQRMEAARAELERALQVDPQDIEAQFVYDYIHAVFDHVEGKTEQALPASARYSRSTLNYSILLKGISTRIFSNAVRLNCSS